MLRVPCFLPLDETPLSTVILIGKLLILILKLDEGIPAALPSSIEAIHRPPPNWTRLQLIAFPIKFDPDRITAQRAIPPTAP